MAWPPPVLPINRTNATPQLDTHAADHNAVNLAVNDIVTKIGSGIYTLRVNDGVTSAVATSGLLVQYIQSYQVTTDYYGEFDVIFATPFAGTVRPFVGIFGNGQVAAGSRMFTQLTVAYDRTHWYCATPAGPLRDTVMQVNVIAVGTSG